MADSKVSALSAAGAFSDADLMYIVQGGVSYKTTWGAIKAAILLAKYPEVANFAALPSAASHTGETYVCLAAQGVYFVNRKPPGFYYSDGATWGFVGELPEDYFTDSILEISDDSDPTKICKFQLSSITTGTTRTLTVPDANGTIMLVGDAPASHTHPQSDVTNLTTDLAAKAPLASPTFTGTPAAPTAAADTNTTQIATTAFAKGEADAAQAYAIQRANHTGTQAISTITGVVPADQGGAGTVSGILKANGSGTVSAASAGTDYPVLNAQKKVIGIEIGDGDNVITTGTKGYLRVPWACTITKATVLETSATPVAGSIVLDVWKDTYANYPPTNADSITASAKPTLSTATKSEDSTLTGWTTSVAAGDTLGVEVESVTSCTRVLLLLEVTLS